METGNPNLKRDGAIADSVLKSGRGTGIFLREWFSGVRIVRAFNTVWDPVLAKKAHRVEPRVGIPLASAMRMPTLFVAGAERLLDTMPDAVLVILLIKSGMMPNRQCPPSKLGLLKFHRLGRNVPAHYCPPKRTYLVPI
jgi:hypothetical protein